MKVREIGELAINWESCWHSMRATFYKGPASWQWYSRCLQRYFFWLTLSHPSQCKGDQQYFLFALCRTEINAGWASGSRDETSEGLQYKDAGVDIEAGDYLVQVIKPLAKMTRRSGCDADLGGFGGVFDLAKAGMSNCVITCRTRGVGRKIKVSLRIMYVQLWTNEVSLVCVSPVSYYM